MVEMNKRPNGLGQLERRTPLGNGTIERCSSRVSVCSAASQSPFSDQRFLKPAFCSPARQPSQPRAWCQDRSIWDARLLQSSAQELGFVSACMLLDAHAAHCVVSREIARQPATRCISPRSGSNVNCHWDENAIAPAMEPFWHQSRLQHSPFDSAEAKNSFGEGFLCVWC